MAQPRLLLDQGLPRSAAAVLRTQDGWEAVHVGERGLARATDAEILEVARRETRICVTLDADFHALLALSGADAPSTIRIRIEGLDAAGLAQVLRQTLIAAGPALDAGAAITVSEHRIRLRRLPIGAAALD
jgi:predicted nuclease of predicted toxin-antitoxin system